MATSPDAKPGLGHPQPCVLDWQGEPCEPCAALSKPQDGDDHVVAFPGPPGEKGEPGLPGFGLPGKQVSFRASGAGNADRAQDRVGPHLGGSLGSLVSGE